MQRRMVVALLAGSALGAARLAADTPAEIRITRQEVRVPSGTRSRPGSADR